MPADVRHAEEHVADLVLDLPPIGRIRHCATQLLNLLIQLVESSLNVRPIEPDLRGALAQLHSPRQRWERDRNSVEHARTKEDVLNACFPSQVEREWWDDETFLGLMRLRGIECRSHYAEAFFCSKLLIDLGPIG